MIMKYIGDVNKIYWMQYFFYPGNFHDLDEFS